MYEKGKQVNQKAIAGYRQYNALFPAVENGAFLYVYHNQHMLATCAIMNGDFEDAESSSRLLRELIPADYCAQPTGSGIPSIHVYDGAL